jgi:excisionase family DNA binding protein
VSLTNLSEREPLAFTIGDFCRAVGLGRSTVYALLDKGELESVKIGYRRLIPYKAAQDLLERSKVSTAKHTDAA